MTALGPAVIEWIRERGRLLDQAIAAACAELINRNDDQWSDWEVQQGFSDLLALHQRADCPYDRPSIGVSYALWYHGVRTHDALRLLAPLVLRADSALRIVDLGCGTGATASAIGLLQAGLEAAGAGPPVRVRVEGVDSSPFMVKAAQAIDQKLCRELDRPATASFECGRWTDIERAEGEEPVLVGGYLLDQSDDAHAEELGQSVLQLGDRLEARGVILFTAPQKVTQLESVIAGLQDSGWTKADLGQPLDAVWSGKLSACAKRRGAWHERHDVTIPPFWELSPSWNRRSLPQLSALRRPPGPAGPTLFKPGGPRLVRDEEQEEAAKPDGRLTAIIGAAGSGKSLVLAQRVVETILATPTADPEPRILVTAFNRCVVDLLKDWILELMLNREQQGELSSVQDTVINGKSHYEISATHSGREILIKLVNCDLLPHGVLGQPKPAGEMGFDQFAAEVEHRKQVEPSLSAALTERLTPTFLWEELECVIYGQGPLSGEEYLACKRDGRRTGLPEADRGVVWRILQKDPFASFIQRRIECYRSHHRAIEAGRPLALEERWTHVFVDECQDFTPADFQLLARVPPDPRALVVAGDESQSVHLGATYRRPRIAGRDWRIHTLRGSYRLPLRVAEALQPLAKEVHRSHNEDDDRDGLDTVLMEARKGAVLGPRPIVVEGGPGLAQDLKRILDWYSPLLNRSGRPKVLCAESDDATQDATASAAAAYNLDPKTLSVGGMKQFKGTEWSCVVFSDRLRTPAGETLAESVFTSLTRTTCLLVLVLWPDGHEGTTALVGKLRSDRLMFLTRGAEQRFHRARDLDSSQVPALPL